MHRCLTPVYIPNPRRHPHTHMPARTYMRVEARLPLSLSPIIVLRSLSAGPSSSRRSYDARTCARTYLREAEKSLFRGQTYTDVMCSREQHDAALPPVNGIRFRDNFRRSSRFPYILYTEIYIVVVRRRRIFDTAKEFRE